MKRVNEAELKGISGWQTLLLPYLATINTAYFSNGIKVLYETPDVDPGRVVVETGFDFMLVAPFDSVDEGLKLLGVVPFEESVFYIYH